MTRYRILSTLISLITALYILKLAHLQLFSDYATISQKNIIRKVYVNPTRGNLYDRHLNILAGNQPSFIFEIIPGHFSLQDTQSLLQCLEITQEEFAKNYQQARKYSLVLPSPIVKYIDYSTLSELDRIQWQIDGYQINFRNIRKYHTEVGSHVLGYISEITSKELKTLNKEDEQKQYRPGDYIGRSGIERYYEELLSGRNGIAFLITDVVGRVVGSYQDGAQDIPGKPGYDLQLTLDIALQRFAEQLLVNKKGSIVAIEPKTGEILVLASSPSYPPHLLSGKHLFKHWSELAQHPEKPLLNRAIQGTYPPGSTLKLLNALIALQTGTLRPHDLYGCALGFLKNGGRPKCHHHPSPLSLIPAIQHSCNAYFANVYVDYMHNPRFKNIYEAYNTWYQYMKAFGLGDTLGIDLPYEKKGFLPKAEYYDRYYGKGRWNAFTNISNAIGQGEILLTPLQMANVVAAIANKGYYIKPHLLKRVLNADIALTWDTIRIPIDQSYFEMIHEGMELVVSGGTGFWARIPNIRVCGKTGTAQNPHGEDHSIFVAFAPREDPKIAIAVVIENAGFGSLWAAPIAALVMEKYLTGTISQQNQWQLERILTSSPYQPKKASPTTSQPPDPARPNPSLPTPSETFED
jgi:penicillin-binding protein 2